MTGGHHVPLLRRGNHVQNYRKTKKGLGKFPSHTTATGGATEAVPTASEDNELNV
jgi:hypothetical protein